MLIFFKVFFEKLFQEYHQSVKTVWIQFIGPDLGTNCLQWLSAEDSDKQRVKVGLVFRKMNCKILFVCSLGFFMSQSTAMVMSRWSVHLTTLFVHIFSLVTDLGSRPRMTLKSFHDQR